MKHIATLITILVFGNMAQAKQNNNSYDALWKQVEQLESENLTSSALKVVNSISEKAKREINSPQIVKSLLYASKYAITLEENAQLKIINDFKVEIEKATFPTKNVLESYLANLYWQYFQQNRYQFYNRSTTEEKIDTIDFRTWDLTTLFQEIGLHFNASLENNSGLQQIPVSSFDVLLAQQKNSEDYRPTLFDLLAHTALDFYKSSENSITRPAHKFEINDPELLCEAKVFSELSIDLKDSTSMQARALEIYRQLINFHLNTQKPYTLAEVDLERLQFTRQNAKFENKDQQYLEVLQNMVEATKGTPAASLYSYEIAALYKQWGLTFTPNGATEHQWKLKEALALCNEVINDHPKSRGANTCELLKSQILTSSLVVTTEAHIPTNKPARLLVTYKNHEGLQFSARRVSKQELEQLDQIYEESKQLDFLKKLPVSKDWDSALKTENDHQLHSTEIQLPPLSNGRYIILAMPKENGTGTFAFSPVQVTDFAVLETRTPTQHIFQIVDRQNGSPIVEASVKLSYQLRYDGPIKTQTLTTDTMGMITLPLTDDYWNNLSLTISHPKGTAFYDNYNINQKYDPSRFNHDHVAFLFTDRSIYRPGQPLYFKGIALRRELGQSTVLENTLVTVSLKDVNYQEVAKQELKTNSFGSFSGEFILPSGGLTGNFTLEVSSNQPSLRGSANFLVEEYKKPKFQTSFTPVNGTYRVDDNITVKGNATAYAGSTITDAKVVYRVKRVVNFPRWYSWHRPYYNSTPQEITFGETQTDASGNYEIDFKAIPDLDVAAKNLPVFSYEVTADVTDINGETHTATTTVRAGYHALTANIFIADQLDRGSKEHRLTLTTMNLNGQFVPAEGTLKIYKLTPPSQVFRPRPWPAPDYPGFTKAEFQTLYPNDAFTNEDDFTQWKKGKLEWETSFDTAKSTEIALVNLKKWISGKYVVELQTTDKFGQEVKDVSYTTLFSETEQQLADNQLFDSKTDKTNYTIGETAKITMMSNAKDLEVTIFIEKAGRIAEKRIIRFTTIAKSFSVPVTKDDLGGFVINYSFSAYNSAHNGSLNISVPYPEKVVQLETLTFRDKLKPNTEETWSFKIKGEKDEQLTAELLAGMYDASLDAFRGHSWNFSPIYRPTYWSNIRTNAYQSYGTNDFTVHHLSKKGYSYTPQYFDSFNWFGLYFRYSSRYGDDMMTRRTMKSGPMNELEDNIGYEVSADAEGVAAGAPLITGSALSKKDKDRFPSEEKTEPDVTENTSLAVQIRKNLQETAFFFPQLQTDKEGNVSFTFTTPEALTRWNLQLLAHTKDLRSTYTTRQTVTQKELMVIPNAPRFLREDDEIIISTKIANLSKQTLSGMATLELEDALTGENITSNLIGSPTSGALEGAFPFSVDSMGNTQVSWRLKITKNLQAVQYRVIANAGDFSDGEQNLLPVLTNRTLVTETLPMWVRSNQSKSFVLDKLKNLSSTEGTTLKHHKLTLEMTSNPAWYAVQALPYLMEYPYECNEQTFARYYANNLASYIANSNPRIQAVFEQWRNADALISNLEKNEELKSLLIQETPWLRDAQSETEQKKRIALLFDLNKLRNEQVTALYKLEQNQKSSGAWAWFNGGPDNRYITQYIIAGLGHLKKLTSSELSDNEDMIETAVAYLDAEFIDEHTEMKRYATNLNDDHLSATQVHYLYMRSLFPDIKSAKKVDDITAYYKTQVQKYWMKRSLYEQGMLALIMHRTGDSKTATKILTALEENSITSEELGMYWKENTASWYWYQAPIETQALLIEAFSEIRPQDLATVDNLKIWLLKNKQTNQWKTTKATTEAVYALLLQGNDWLSITDAVEVLVGGEKIDPSQLENVEVEAGTGYYKTAWNGSEVEPKMGEVQISKKGEGIAWGALYWQYFEDLDKITAAETPLKLHKKLFLKTNTATGEEISEITPKTNLRVGDLVRVRIELRADRPMEFVHMKDMRAAGFEPINVFSQYKWQDGLGYYEATKDVSTNFFFDHLPKGVFIFEYNLRVNNAGDFSNGITTIQSMYAPEFSSHSEGVRVKVGQ